jgi:serine/threonine-protein kinase
MRLVLPASLASALTVLITASLAHAQATSDDVRAAALFTEGRQLMAAGDYAAACPKLAESQALAPAADTALDLAICYQYASQAAFKVAHDLSHSSEQGTAVAAPSVALSETPPPTTGQTQRTVGLVIGGAGLVGVVAGVILGVDAKLKYDHISSSSECNGGNVCNPSAVAALDSARALATASTVSVIAGAAVLGGGAIVFFTAPKTSPAPTLGLGPAAQGAGLAAVGRF